MVSKIPASHSLADVCRDIDQLVINHIQIRQDKAKNLSSDYGLLWEALKTTYQAGGKRLRPYLCVFAYDALDGKDYKSILPVAGALELLHNAMLIHDDIIDRDYTRRGADNMAGMYRNRYKVTAKSSAEKDHFANSAALLAGDLMLSEAYQLVRLSSLPDIKKLQVIELIGETIHTVVGGELLDTEAVLNLGDITDTLLIAELKTASYSFVTPLLLGGMLAGVDEASLSELKTIGTNLGIAFQLADDIAGIFDSPAQTGKPPYGDIREGKQTYLLQKTLQLCTPAQIKQLQMIIGNADCTKTMAHQAKTIMNECGAKQAVEQKIQTYTKQATDAVNKLPLSAQA